MPRLNRLGDAVMGVAGATTSINGAVPPSLVGSAGGGWDWLNDTTILGQAGIPSLHSGAWRIYKTTAIAVAATDVANVTANVTRAGGDIYELWGSYGIATNVVAVPSLPNAGPGDVDDDGVWAVGTLYGTASGVTVYDPLGTVLQQINVSLASTADGSQAGSIRMRDGWLAYYTSTGWEIVDAVTGRPAEGYVKQQGVTGLFPVDAGGKLVVVEWNAPLASWTIRNADSGTGLVVNTGGTLSFGMDAIYLGGQIRLAWSTGQGEAAGELVILDVDTATGDTQRGTVVGSTLVFAAGPTLEGSRFKLAQGPIVYPPYKDEMNVTQTIGGKKKKTISQPWVRYLNSTSQGVGSLQAGASSVNPPTPPSSLGTDAQVVLGASSPSFTNGRVVTNSPSVTWDLSNPFQLRADVVGGAIGGWIPLVDGSEPPVFITDGAGVLILVPGPS